MGTIQVGGRRALLAAALVLAAGCRGPDPAVERASLAALQPGDPVFRVETVVMNRGGGTGEIDLEARLIQRTDGTVVARGKTGVALDPHARQIVVLELPRPPSFTGTAADLELRVDARYPAE